MKQELVSMQKYKNKVVSMEELQSVTQDLNLNKGLRKK